MYFSNTSKMALVACLKSKLFINIFIVQFAAKMHRFHILRIFRGSSSLGIVLRSSWPCLSISNIVIYQFPLILTALLHVDLINVAYLTAYAFIRSSWRCTILNDVVNDVESTRQSITTCTVYVVIASLKSEPTCKLPGSRLLISSLPGKASRMLVESLGYSDIKFARLSFENACWTARQASQFNMRSRSLAFKLDIRRHSSGILHLSHCFLYGIHVTKFVAQTRLSVLYSHNESFNNFLDGINALIGLHLGGCLYTTQRVNYYASAWFVLYHYAVDTSLSLYPGVPSSIPGFNCLPNEIQPVAPSLERFKPEPLPVEPSDAPDIIKHTQKL